MTCRGYCSLKNELQTSDSAQTVIHLDCKLHAPEQKKGKDVPAPPRPVETMGAGFFISLKKVEILLPVLAPLVEVLSASFVTAAISSFFQCRNSLLQVSSSSSAIFQDRLRIVRFKRDRLVIVRSRSINRFASLSLKGGSTKSDQDKVWKSSQVRSSSQ